MDSEDKSAISVLTQERDDLLKEVELIDRLIARINLRSSPKTTPPVPTVINGTQTLSNVNVPNAKPRIALAKAPFQQRMQYVLQEHLKHAVRFPELKEAFEALKLPVGNLRQSVSELRVKGLITAIKYNNSAVTVYMGPKEWVVESETGPTFKEEHFILDERLFPSGIYSSEMAMLSGEKQEGHPEGQP